MNDQFPGSDPWEAYLHALESCSPVIEAIGVTDYYNLDCYEKLAAAKESGRLPNCSLVFPNIEMRLALGTPKGQWINFHLLISPDDPNHVEEVKRFLGRLTFEAFDDTFSCTTQDLMRLGVKTGINPSAQAAALTAGSEQFKVDFKQLKSEYTKNAWAKANIILAVAGGKDGTSGLQADSASAVLRQEVEKFSHMIFSSSPAQREFWLGLKSDTPEKLTTKYGGLKPCLHGCDAHRPETVGRPDGDRYSWVKGDAIFDSLKQACVDPGSRAYVGAEPPSSLHASQAISKVHIQDAPWIMTPTLNLNPGLVAIVGARGSGKTALADVIAAGCGSRPSEGNKQSFLHRAKSLLDNSSVKLSWESGSAETIYLDSRFDFSGGDEAPRARYLSQQFVEGLCSSDGMTDGLLNEIERIVFEAHSAVDRDGTIDFKDLLELKAMRHRQARARDEASLAALSEQIGVEQEKIALLPSYKTQAAERQKTIARLETDRAKLVMKGSEERVKQLTELTQATEAVRSYVRAFNLQHQQLLIMQDEVRDFRAHQAPESLRSMQLQHGNSGLKADDWHPFLIDYKGPVDDVLRQKISQAQKGSADWKGTPPAPIISDASFLPSGVELTRLPLATLEAEIARLQQLVTVDRATADLYTNLSKRIVEETNLLNGINEKLKDAEGATNRRSQALDAREACYVQVFDAILAEQEVLRSLYSPIKSRLEAGSGSLQKLSFSVNRVVDVGSWADAGEQLLDLRKQGPFKGKGTLAKVADESLRGGWETGTSQEISQAMKSFREQHQNAFLEHAPYPKSQQADYRNWTKKFAKWLYGTDHISIEYTIDYSGIDIRNLSPGTRGIVLLLLYLALDDADDRPLIIDQPEENLDPKSIYDELVDLFKKAKLKRQVIMVTHNANLVINTDADQIIVASVGTYSPGSLPPITYISGGLESEKIRKLVCEILEGGESAFRERARRLRVLLER
jgi:ABC-type lipoprotein export system ATPase subunit